MSRQLRGDTHSLCEVKPRSAVRALNWTAPLKSTPRSGQSPQAVCLGGKYKNPRRTRRNTQGREIRRVSIRRGVWKDCNKTRAPTRTYDQSDRNQIDATLASGQSRAEPSASRCRRAALRLGWGKKKEVEMPSRFCLRGPLKLHFTSLWSKLHNKSANPTKKHCSKVSGWWLFGRNRRFLPAILHFHTKTVLYTQRRYLIILSYLMWSLDLTHTCIFELWPEAFFGANLWPVYVPSSFSWSGCLMKALRKFPQSSRLQVKQTCLLRVFFSHFIFISTKKIFVWIFAHVYRPPAEDFCSERAQQTVSRLSDCLNVVNIYPKCKQALERICMLA